MLTPEQARDYLESRRVKDAAEQRLAAMAALPDVSLSEKLARIFKKDEAHDLSLREIGYAILHHDRSGKPFRADGHTYDYSEEQRAAVRRGWQGLAALDSDERVRIFAAIFPTMAREVELLWQAIPNFPYQFAYTRKAFRAPGHEELFRGKRENVVGQLIRQLGGYHEDVLWFAQYAPYLSRGYGAMPLDELFAAVIDADLETSEPLFQILLASGRGEHEVGMMGRHVTRGLLRAARPDGWTFMEKMLLAAQRQEGLRQDILEAVDEAQPDAFRRMLRVILDNDLVRFSAVTRAMNVWFGFMWDSESTRVVNATLEQAARLLDSGEARDEALRSGNGEAVYLALWALAYTDAFAAIPAAEALLDDADVERRFAAVHLLVNLGLSATHRGVRKALADPDLRVAVRAVEGVGALGEPECYDLFEPLENLVLRLPKDDAALPPIIWGWMGQVARRERAASYLLTLLGERSPKRLIPHLAAMDGWTRVKAAQELAKLGMGDSEIRDVLIRLIGDRETHVRKEMLALFGKHTIQPDEAPYLESLLTRKTDDLRRGVLSLLAHQPSEQAVGSAERLVGARKVEQRLAGLELLQIVYQRGEAETGTMQACRAQALAYQASHADLSDAEKNLIEAITRQDEAEVTLDNALGLMNPTGRSKPVAPQKRNVTISTSAGLATLVSLDDLIHEQRKTLIMVKTWQGENQEWQLGYLNDNLFPVSFANIPIQEDAARLPLRELWEQWVETRPRDMLDDDGLELLRALLEARVQANRRLRERYNQPVERPGAPLNLKYAATCAVVLRWLVRLYPAPNTADFLLDCLDNALALVPKENLRAEPNPSGRSNHWLGLPNEGDARGCLERVSQYWDEVGSDWEDRHTLRCWGLLRWIDEPTEGALRQRPTIRQAAEAHRLGAASDDDLYDLLLGPRSKANVHHASRFTDLEYLSERKLRPGIPEYPVLMAIFERCRDRVLDVELKRGAMPTPATAPALALKSVPGTRWFVRILQAMGDQAIARERGGESRSAVFSKLLRTSYPTEADTAEAFAQQVKAAKLSEKPLIEAAVYAPQWAAHIQAALGWNGFVEAVWWLHAHTKDRRWFLDQSLKEAWNAEINSRTPLSGDDLLEGAVDVSWFWRMYAEIGAARWQKVYAAAKYATSGVGHARAKLFADAMLGKVDQVALVKRITEKRNQDAVRALGLVPLAKIKRDDDLLARYQVVQEFLRTSRKGGAQRRESEKRAAEIGMENLARTGDYADPQRLQWAMETREADDLRGGEIRVNVEDVTVTLTLDVVGKPQIEIVKGGKRLKAIPPKLKKNTEIVVLQERKRQIDKQHARMRLSLENAMCRADQFAGSEIGELMQHPVLAPMLQQLIFVGEGMMGYPSADRQALERFDGSSIPLQAEASLRIAHAHDLYTSGEWSQWQRDCFLAERIQPFKQVYRELYLLTETERGEGSVSRRYAGHQVQPKQALALLGTRGWVAHPDYGVQKTFHGQNFTVHLDFLGGYWTPAQVEGLTIERVIFTKPNPFEVVQLADVPPITFSEVMRDLDLVVSVAHRGGVDPETTASTVEMRAALIRETMALLKIGNVTLHSKHAEIEGALGSYSVHLGSAIVHRMPGGAICIIPVHAQHRGRIFLPFADDDPKTAEVISKVLLLAQDTQIKDPSILEQIYAKA